MGMDAAALKGLGMLVTSPASYFYYKYNKKAQNARELFWEERNREKIDRFEEITGAREVGEITQLKEEALLDFLSYLQVHMKCSYNCSEIQIYTEIYALWEDYQKSNPPSQEP
ncbi:MAG: hypothetical protein R2751_16840 [Bacteroidales bacterium]